MQAIGPVAYGHTLTLSFRRRVPLHGAEEETKS
jgi:hypothetical protein